MGQHKGWWWWGKATTPELGAGLGIVVGSTIQSHWCGGSQTSQRRLLQFQHIDPNRASANEHLWIPWCTSTPLSLLMEATESSLMKQARSEGRRYRNLEDLIEYFYYIFLEPSLSPLPTLQEFNYLRKIILLITRLQVYFHCWELFFFFFYSSHYTCMTCFVTSWNF